MINNEALRAYINSALELEDPDPHVLAERTFDLLPPNTIRQLALDGWRAQIHRTIQRRRKTITSDNIDIQRVAIGSVDDMQYRWAHLKDCTVFDVRKIIVAHRDRAAQSSAIADRYDRLEQAMLDHNAEVVGDLPDELVAEILGGKPHEAGEEKAA